LATPDFVITPNGKTAFLRENAGIQPVNLAERTLGELIPVSVHGAAEVTPDGRTLYTVGTRPLKRSTILKLTGISTLTGKQVTSLTVKLNLTSPTFFGAFAITPNGRSGVYCILGGSGTAAAVDINFAARKALSPIYRSSTSGTCPLVFTPDSSTALLGVGAQVIRVDMASGAALKLVKLPWSPSPLAISANGSTLYAVWLHGRWSEIVPVSVRTGVLLKPIYVSVPRNYGCDTCSVMTLTVAPSGTVYAGNLKDARHGGFIRSVNLSTGKVGPAITVRGTPMVSLAVFAR
jgi:hypothetical protein